MQDIDWASLKLEDIQSLNPTDENLLRQLNIKPIKDYENDTKYCPNERFERARKKFIKLKSKNTSLNIQRDNIFNQLKNITDSDDEQDKKTYAQSKQEFIKILVSQSIYAIQHENLFGQLKRMKVN